MVRTLITGAAGFTGRYLASALADRGHEVHGLVHGGAPQHIPGVTLVHAGDISDNRTVQSVIDEIRPQHVVHLAAVSFVGHLDVQQMYLVNVVGSRNLLGALTCLAEPPKSVLIVSSANVYGNSRKGLL